MEQYEEILKVLFSPSIEGYIPDGIAHSEAICEKADGKIYDCFFLYSANIFNGEKYGPVARLAIDFEEKKLVAYEEYEDGETFSDQSVGESGEIEASLEIYEELYPQLRKIIKKAVLTDGDYDLLRRVYGAIEHFTNDRIKGFYRKTAPTTFALLEQAYSQK